MLVELSNIISSENKVVNMEVEITFPFFDAGMGEFPILEKAPFTLCIANEENKRLHLEGSTDVAISVPCDRCLEPVTIPFHLTIQKAVEIQCLVDSEESKGDELQELDGISGTSLDVDKLIFGEILVSWPMKVLCREDCQGICKQCGTNLNHKTCPCQKAEPDPRMSAIQEIFNQYKEV